MRLVGLDRKRQAVERPRRLAPGPAQLRVGRAYSARLAMVLGHGCIDCAGLSALNEDGSRIYCPQLLRGMFESDEEREALAGCGVPALYAALHDRERAEITPEDVRAARPEAVQ